MTGPEHYKEAERRIALRDFHEAQVHATLALAAATAAPELNAHPLDTMTYAWLEVLR